MKVGRCYKEQLNHEMNHVRFRIENVIEKSNDLENESLLRLFGFNFRLNNLGI